MKAIIIDDERKGRETLQKMLEKYGTDVEICATASNIHDGYILICDHRPDVVFLDVEMPNGTGFELLEKFDEVSFEVVFTTAYDSYALKAIKVHALDYLLKPIDLDELAQTLENIRRAMQAKPTVNRYSEFLTARKLEFTGKIPLSVKEGIVYITVSEIIRVESDGGYSTFYTGDGKFYVTSRNLKEYEDMLPVKEFFRIHKSHLINMKRVKKFLRVDGYYVEMEDGSTVEISRRKKDEFLQLMNELS